MWDTIADALGIHEGSFATGEMILRAITVYVATVVMVRIGETRAFGRNTAFDIVMGIILGSTLSRAINGSAPLIPTLAAGGVLVGFHWLFAMIAFHSERFGTLVKGTSHTLVSDGEIEWSAMRKHHLTEQELLAALRMQTQVEKLNQVRKAHIEPGGGISFVLNDEKS